MTERGEDLVQSWGQDAALNNLARQVGDIATITLGALLQCTFHFWRQRDCERHPRISRGFIPSFYTIASGHARPLRQLTLRRREPLARGQAIWAELLGLLVLLAGEEGAVAAEARGQGR